MMIPMGRIFADPTFNCRGEIATISIAELARDIQERKLDYPITVQPASDVKGGLPDGFDYRIIAGHRRFKAIQVLGWTEIPCTLRAGMDDIESRVLNLSENLKREDLNILQESRALKGLYDAGLGRDEVASRIGKSSGWVQVRFNLLELPSDVQEEAAAGIFTQHQIKQLHSLRQDPDKMYEAVRTVKEAKNRSEKVTTRLTKRKKSDPNIKKARQPDEIVDMIQHVKNAAGFGLATRALAWASGGISTAEFFDDLKDNCNTGPRGIIKRYRDSELSDEEFIELLEECPELMNRQEFIPPRDF